MNKLSDYATKHGTDKWGHHFYCDIYESYFSKWRHEKITMLEMGFGGYEFHDKGGGSVKMWAEYFTHQFTEIVVSDIFPKSLQGFDSRIKFLLMPDNQQQLIGMAPYHIIIDDASHNSQEIIKDFDQYFPLLKSGGIYVIEDCQTSYWPVEQYHGTANNFGHPRSSAMNYFKYLCDSVNREYIPFGMPEVSNEIFSIHFYEKMIFILKK